MKLSLALPCALGPLLPGECLKTQPYQPSPFYELCFFFIIVNLKQVPFSPPLDLPAEAAFRVIMSLAIHIVTLEPVFPIMGTLKLMWMCGNVTFPFLYPSFCPLILLSANHWSWDRVSCRSIKNTGQGCDKSSWHKISQDFALKWNLLSKSDVWLLFYSKLLNMCYLDCCVLFRWQGWAGW